MKKILVINGPSINLLGYREVDIYGTRTYLDLIAFIKKVAKENDLKVKCLQTNSEGIIIDKLQDALVKKYDGIIINPGAYTHYSYAIRDAIASINMRVVEVHLSDINNREDFRKVNVIKDVCEESFIGKGFDSYKEALEYFCK